MSIAELTSTELSRLSWDWKSDIPFLEQLRQDLRRQAAARIRTGVHAISVSSLVQESLVRLLDAKCLRDPQDRRHLYALAVRAMRFVIVDHIRAQQTLKRYRPRVAINLDEISDSASATSIHILAIHEALEQLSHKDPRQAQVVEMKFFAGCTMPEIAAHLGFGLTTIENDWTVAKQFLANFLSR